MTTAAAPPRLLDVASNGDTSPLVPYYRAGDFDVVMFLLNMS